MKLIELKLKNYKNIADITIDFGMGAGLTMLVGNNGSGKSNILEAISGIFHDAYKTDYLFFDAANNADYEISYTFDTEKISIYRTNGRRAFFVEEKQIPRERFVREGYLPNNVIGIYSGEESRLWTTFYEPYYKAYIRRLNNGLPVEQMRMLFVNKHYWNIALLVLLISRNESIKPFINNDICISESANVLLEFDIEKTERISNELLLAFLQKLNPLNEQFLTLSVGSIAEKIYDQYDVDSIIFNYFIQAVMPKKDKAIKKMEIQLSNGFTSDFLSEGEKKLILIKSSLEFLADEKTLILFDEPDAHIHEARKSHLLEMFSEYPNRQIVMTTHSPAFVELADDNQVVMLKNNVNGYVEQFDAGKLENMRYLTGSRFNAFIDKPILYCEGSETSIEAKLYPILFPNYNIIPSGGHEEVIRHVKTFNKTFATENNYAVGIIDWDYKTEAQIDALANESIYTISVVEIENLLMDARLLECAKKAFCAEECCIEQICNELINILRLNKEKQATKYTSNYIISRIKSELTEERREIERFKQNIAAIWAVENIDALYTERIRKIDDCISLRDYDELVKFFDFNHNIDYIIVPLVNDYTRRVLRLISRNEDLQNYLKERYFSSIINIDK